MRLGDSGKVLEKALEIVVVESSEEFLHDNLAIALQVETDVMA
jgi:hypothetical protein